MPAPNFKAAAKEITRLLFLGTEWNVESVGGRAGDADVCRRIVMREIPKIWPDATPAQLGALATRLPIVNYLRDDRKKVADQIEALLQEHGAGTRAQKSASAKKGRKSR